MASEQTIDNKADEDDKCILSSSQIRINMEKCRTCKGYAQNCFAYIPKSAYEKQNQSMRASLFNH